MIMFRAAPLINFFYRLQFRGFQLNLLCFIILFFTWDYLALIARISFDWHNIIRLTLWAYTLFHDVAGWTNTFFTIYHGFAIIRTNIFNNVILGFGIFQVHFSRNDWQNFLLEARVVWVSIRLCLFDWHTFFQNIHLSLWAYTFIVFRNSPREWWTH